MSYPPSGEHQEPKQPPSPYEPQGAPGGPWGQPPGPPGSPGHQGQYGYPPGQKAAGGTNVLAILSLVLAFIFAPAAIVLGHLAKRQIRQTGEQGEQLATWGLILGYVFTALWIIGCCSWLGYFWVGSPDTNY